MRLSQALEMRTTVVGSAVPGHVFTIVTSSHIGDAPTTVTFTRDEKPQTAWVNYVRGVVAQFPAAPAFNVRTMLHTIPYHTIHAP